MPISEIKIGKLERLTTSKYNHLILEIYFIHIKKQMACYTNTILHDWDLEVKEIFEYDLDFLISRPKDNLLAYDC